MKHTLRWLVTSAVVVVLLGAGLATADYPEKAKTDLANAINVETTQVTEMAIPTTLFSVGSLIALKSANLSSEVNGRITKIYFQNGDFVHAGQPIVQLDNVQAKADLFSSEAALHLSQTTYTRYSALLNEGGVSQETLDQQKSGLESKEADVQTKKVALEQKTIRAPFAGVLGVFNVTQGEYITAGQALVSLVDKQQLKVQYTIPQKYLSRLQLGQMIDVNSDSYPNKIFNGEVSFISPTIDDDTGSVTVQATIDNSENLLSPGMFVTINQIIQEDPNALIIPEQAVVASLQGSYVFVIKNSVAKSVKITLGHRREGYVQVHGLTLGEEIVIAGQQKLDDGTPVVVLPPAPLVSDIPKIPFLVTPATNASQLVPAPNTFAGTSGASS